MIPGSGWRSVAWRPGDRRLDSLGIALRTLGLGAARDSVDRIGWVTLAPDFRGLVARHASTGAAPWLRVALLIGSAMLLVLSAALGRWPRTTTACSGPR